MSYVIRIIGYASDQPCEFAGQYLEWYNPNLPDAKQPMGGFTALMDKAMKFSNQGDAFAEWSRVRLPDPVRPDGKPNRPLTAFTIEVLPAS